MTGRDAIGRPRGLPVARHLEQMGTHRVDAVQREGTCWLGATTWRGQRLMRVSVSNWSTTREDVERSAEAILRCAASL